MKEFDEFRRKALRSLQRAVRLLSMILMLCLLTKTLSACHASSEDLSNSSEVHSASVSGSEASSGTSSEASVNDTEEDGGVSPLRSAAYGGELEMAIVATDSYLPWEITDRNTAETMMLVYEGLFRRCQDGRMQPQLVNSYYMTEDGLSVVLTLRMDVSFHNGYILTASDVAYSLEMLKSKNNSYSEYVDNIAAWEIWDTFTIQIDFKTPGLTSVKDLVFPIVPDRYAEKTIPMGTGPYSYSKTERKREMLLSGNSDYYGTVPYIPTVRLYLVEEASLVRQCFDTTRTNLYAPEFLEWGTYGNDHEKTVHPYESDEALFLEFDTQSVFSKSLSNRQKVAYALDASAILQASYWGKGTITQTLIRPGAWYIGYATIDYEYDEKKAYDIEAEGTTAITVKYDDKDRIQQAAIDVIKEQLTAAGLEVKVTTSGAYDLCLRNRSVGLLDAAEYVGERDLVTGATTEEELKAAALRINRQMSQELPVLTLFFETKGTLTGYGIKGRLEPSDEEPFKKVQELYMNSEEIQ